MTDMDDNMFVDINTILGDTMILSKLTEEQKKQLVMKNKLRFQGSTGEKKVQAYLKLYNGELQVQFRYGKTFYRFKVEESTEEDEFYNKTNNIQNHERTETTIGSDGREISFATGLSYYVKDPKINCRFVR